MSLTNITDLGSFLHAAATSAALDQALTNGEFRVAYQPIVRIHDRALDGFEAFVRWEHPERGLIPAAEFVTVAEQSGQIMAVGWIVARTALRQVQRWSDELGGRIDLHLNISAIQLMEPGFTASLRALLVGEHVDPDTVTLEIACHQLAHPAALRPVFAQLDEIGVRIALDDAGFDDTTFTLLASIEFTTIKIDRTLVRAVAMGDTVARRRLLRLTTLAAEQSLIAVAEGIERDDELEVLTDLGCELAQGYALAKPMLEAAADEFVRAIASRR